MSERLTAMQSFASNKENHPLHPTQKPTINRSRTLEETIIKDYGDSISATHELKEQETSTNDCLRNHRVNEDLRAKMVDWMIEVLDIFNCSLRTLFLSIRVMDLYFKHEPSTIGVEELHVIGVSCMMIASKYEDIKALDMNTIFFKISHEKLPRAYIVRIEKKILKALDYKLFVPTVIDFLEPVLAETPKYMKNLVYYAAELAQLEPKFAWIKPSLLAQALYFLVFGNFGKAGLGDLVVVEVAAELRGFLNGFELGYQSTFNKYQMKPRF